MEISNKTSSLDKREQMRDELNLILSLMEKGYLTNKTALECLGLSWKSLGIDYNTEIDKIRKENVK